jgi:hypothetical protein
MQGYRIDAFEVNLNETGYGNTLIDGKIRIDQSLMMKIPRSPLI